MFSEVFSAVWSAAVWVWDLFFSLADHFGFVGLLLTLHGLYTAVRFLLRPIFGAASSDLASAAWQEIKSYGASPNIPRIRGQKAIESKSRVGKKR